MGRALLLSFVVVAAVIVPSSARAQVSVWLQEGVSGYGVSSSIGLSNGETDLGVEVGYSYRGSLELDLDLGWAHADGDPAISGSDVDGLGVGGGVQFHPVKQSKELPLSVNLQAAYRNLFYFSQILDDAGLSVSGWQTGISAGVYRFVPLAPRIGVTPEVDAGWLHSSATLSRGSDKMTDTSEDIQVVVAANFAFLDGAGRIWGVAPKITFGSLATSFGLSVNFVMPKQ